MAWITDSIQTPSIDIIVIAQISILAGQRNITKCMIYSFVLNVVQASGHLLSLTATGHNPPPPQVRVPRSVARSDKTRRITHRQLESWISGLADVNPPGLNPLSQNPRRFWTRGYVRGVYVRQSWNLAFRTPFPNRKRHRTLCSNSTGVMSWGIMSANRV